jgi:hypothetical protein
MSQKRILLAFAALALIWLFWPRKGIPMFNLEPVVIHAGGDTDNGN